MKNVEDEYFVKLKFTPDQVKKNLGNALRDLAIAKEDKILEVRFNYAYTSLIKAGIALLSFYGLKVRSAAGHHIKIIEKTAEILKDEAVADIGNLMRSKRNLDLYAGGIEITEKECHEYVAFIDKVISKIKQILKP